MYGIWSKREQTTLRTLRMYARWIYTMVNTPRLRSLVDHLTLADCNSRARGQKQGDITNEEKQESEKKKETSRQPNQ